MKKIILFFSLLLLANSSYSQIYEPMVADSTLWKIHVPRDWAMYGYLTSGTEQFQGKTYSKLYRIQFMGSFSQLATNQATSINQIGLLREENRQVFLVPTVSPICACAQGQETLIYDFGAAVGDTIYSGLRDSSLSFSSSPEPYFIVSAIDTVNGDLHQEALVPSVDSNMNSQLPNQHQRELIRIGVGALGEPFSCITGTDLSHHGYLYYFNRGADITNHYYAVGIDVIEAASQWFVYPNPATDRLYVGETSESKYPLHAVIYDLQGRRVLDQTLSSEVAQQGIELAQLPTGLYVLQLSDVSGHQKQLRFVKQ